MPYDWSAQVELHDVIALRRRLIASVTGEERPLVLLVGSAASAPQTRGGLGVPGVREMVELILDEVGGVYSDVARNLVAARESGSHHHRRRVIEQARRGLSTFEGTVTAQRRPEPLQRRLLPTARLWHEVIQEELARLVHDEAKSPQVPQVFEAGAILQPEQASLFKGRADLVALIDQDLSSPQRSPLLLQGQRRVGKSSLLAMLPRRLGTATTVVTTSFQRLTGEGNRLRPVQVVGTAVSDAIKEAGQPPAGAWVEVLRWLEALDAELGASDRRLLIAVDEAERLEDGIRQGWTTPEFLDFVRAAGDTLRHTRIMLVSAWPLDRLGDHWCDRLISATTRRVGYLEPEQARELILEPIPDFPDIYPDRGAERIIELTACQPYLVQKLCLELCLKLNRERRMVATMEDLERVSEAILVDNIVFRELWNERLEEERKVLYALARDEAIDDPRSKTVRRLIHDGFVKREDDRLRLVIPLFAAWIEAYA